MEKFPTFSHYCDDEQNKLFVAYSLKDKATRKYDVPYSTIFLFDSAQISNQIYFTGGGMPAITKEEEEQFFTIAARVTIHSNLESGTERLADMLVPRANHTLVALGTSRLFAMGGCNDSGETSSCEVYDVGKNQWLHCASLTEAKKWVSVCTFEDRYVYAFGGATKDKTMDSDVIECLDTGHMPVSPEATWQVVELLAGKALWKHCIFLGAAQVSPGEVLLFGGLMDKCESAESFIFSPKKRSIERIAPLGKADEFYRTKPQILGDELMMVGSPLGDLHVFKISTHKWTAIEKNVWNPEDVFHIKSETY